VDRRRSDRVSVHRVSLDYGLTAREAISSLLKISS
jgi:hypothetical protein